MLLWNIRKPPALARPGTALTNAAIIGYQRYLSPYKGFRCAYAVLHRSPGCSEAVRQLILRYGLAAAWPHVRQRFADCAAAMHILRMQRAQAPAAQQAAQPGEESECDKPEKWLAYQALDCGAQIACNACFVLPC